MTGPDRLFGLGAVTATLVVPGLLVALRPTGEAREVLGYLAGWAVALSVMVPSYVLLSRGLRSSEPRRFLGSVLGGSLGRLFTMAAAFVVFAVTVPQAPKASFLVALALGYLVLMVIELVVVLGRSANGRTA